MYINTHQVKLSSQKGWWGLTHNPKLSFDIAFGEREYGMTGAKSIKTWARTGRCNKPTGQHASMWRTLMLVHGARYIAMDYGGCIDIEIMDPDLLNQIKHGPKLKDMEAKSKLLSAAFGSGSSSIYLQELHKNLRTALDGTQLHSNHSVRLTTQYSREGHRALFQAFVSEFGPALSGDPLCALIADANAKRPVSVACKLDISVEDNGYWSRYSGTTIMRKRKRR